MSNPTPSSPERPVRLVFLASGQILIGQFVGHQSVTQSSPAFEDSVILLNPRELLLTPTEKGGAEISLIPFGHIGGVQLVKVEMLRVLRSQYLIVAPPDDPKLAAQFLANQNSHQNF